MKAGLRDQVWRRAGGRCEYCHLPQQFDTLPFQVDHVIPRKHRGPTSADNLALSCLACNAHKGSNLTGIDDQTGALAPLFHPRRDVWENHFSWDGPRLVGKSATGRATIAVLDVNQPARVEHRRLLLALGCFAGWQPHGALRAFE